jgi:thymidine kinase
MTVLVYYQKNKVNLAVLITRLQTELSTSDDIYVVDTSKDRSGLEIARLYGTSRNHIFIEVGDYTFPEAVKFATQSMNENKQGKLLILDENAFISQTLIQNVKRAQNYNLIPITKRLPYDRMDPNFKLFNASFKDEVILLL